MLPTSAGHMAHGFCTLSNAAQAQRVYQKWRFRTHMLPTSAEHVAVASVHSQMLRRRRESNKDGAVALTCFLFLQDTWPMTSVHSQMLRRRRESIKNGAFALTCFLLLQNTWPWLLYTLKCCAGAESPTKMVLLHSRASYYCRTLGPGICAVPNAAQAQKFQQR
jgi:hypothetical protein